MSATAIIATIPPTAKAPQNKGHASIEIVKAVIAPVKVPVPAIKEPISVTIIPILAPKFEAVNAINALCNNVTAVTARPTAIVN